MGRTLDYEFSYGDEITVTPRNYSFTLRHGGKLETTMLSLAWPMLQETILFYYDAINEKGLGIAGLNFRWKRNIQTRRSKQFQTSDHPV